MMVEEAYPDTNGVAFFDASVNDVVVRSGQDVG